MDLATHSCRRAADALECVRKSFHDAKPTFPDAVTPLAKLYFVVGSCALISFLLLPSIQLMCAREAAKFAATGSAIGAISTAGIAWKYLKSPHGPGPVVFEEEPEEAAGEPQ